MFYQAKPEGFALRCSLFSRNFTILAKELQADILIIDERMGYKVAQSQGLFVVGTLSILAMAKMDGHIENVKPFINDLITNGRWYSPQVCSQFLKEMGEL